MGLDEALETYKAAMDDLKLLEVEKKKTASLIGDVKDVIEEARLSIQNQCEGGYNSSIAKVTVRNTPAKLIVADESIVPDSWFIEKTTRALDKNGIKSALKKGEEINGCSLSNGGQTISIELKE